MSVTVVSGGIIAMKKLIENITTDLYKKFKDGYSEKLKRIEALNNASSLYTKIDEVSKVKTIWQTDKAVQLQSFYCNTYIKYGEKRKLANSLSDIEFDGNLLIEGIAGQGKSIFMRYLCASELSAGNTIPVFMELRRLTENVKLIDYIHIKLRELGFDIDDEIFNYLCSINKMLFLLDGFDEVPEKMHIPLINEIETLSSTNIGIRFIVSSRPGTGLEYLPSLQVIKIDHVKDDEYKELVIKLSDGLQAANNLIEQVDNHKGNIKQLLCTPLMITLLVYTYKAYQKVPEQLSDFFERMFHLMLQRHDGSKPGFRREKKCNLNDMEYQKIFEALCYLIKDKGQSYKLSLLYSVADKAIKYSRIKSNPQDFITDIKKITCLLLYEGSEYSFLHKSIQEYFAASFIKSKPDSVASKFYASLISDGYNWSQEMLFLEDIDKYRFYKYFYIPLSCKILNLSSKHVPKKIKIRNIDYIMKFTEVYKFENEKRFYYGFDGSLRVLLNRNIIRKQAWSILLNSMFTSDSFYKNRDVIVINMLDTTINSKIKTATLFDIHQSKICTSEIVNYAEHIHDLIHSQALEVQSYLKEEDKADFLSTEDN